MESSNTEIVNTTKEAEVDIPWDTTLALVLGGLFSVYVFIINILNVIYTIPLGIILFSQIMLFLAGYGHWKALKNPEIDQDPNVLFKQKYKLMVFSLIMYIIGSLLLTSIFNSDSTIQLTYLSIFPILVSTIDHFNFFFEKSKLSDTANENLLPAEIKNSLVPQIPQYKRMFTLPLILNILGSVIVLILPWYSTTISSFDSEAFYNCTSCTPADASKYTINFTQNFGLFNIGISMYLVIGTIVLVLVSSFLVYLSFERLLKTHSRSLTLMGMGLSIFGSIIVILGLLTLIYHLYEASLYGANPVLYYSFESGFILGFILFFFSTAIIMNLYKTLSEEKRELGLN